MMAAQCWTSTSIIDIILPSCCSIVSVGGVLTRARALNLEFVKMKVVRLNQYIIRAGRLYLGLRSLLTKISS